MWIYVNERKQPKSILWLAAIEIGSFIPMLFSLYSVVCEKEYNISSFLSYTRESSQGHGLLPNTVGHDP